MAHPFLDRLARGPILADGAMGTLLHARGVSFEHGFDELNSSHREMVQKVHQDYIQAGAEIIETNTFAANRFKLAHHGLEEKVRDLNRAGAKVAREAREVSGRSIFIAGSLGPTGKHLEPWGKMKAGEARDAFREQIEALLEGGVDLFIFETFSDLREMLLVVEACRQVTDLPIIAEMTFNEEGMTLGGNPPEEVVKELSTRSVEVIGANCSVGPQRLIEVLERMEVLGERKLAAMPNAGFPRMIDGRYIYFSSPEYFAECTEKFLRAGAWVLGGCCGTTPAHIQAMAEVLRRVNGMTRVAVSVESAPTERIEITSTPRELSLFARKAGREFTVSVELDPPKGVSTQKILEGARLLKENGIQVVNIADSPMAQVRMSCIALAILALRIGLDVVLHFTCRDRNLMGLQSDLLGAHALGIRNILALTGDPPSVGDYPGVTAVYDADSVGLVGILSSLNQGKDIVGNSIGQPTSFFVGAALNGNAPDLGAEADKVKRKRDNGASFLFTQPVYQTRDLERLLDLIREVNLPVFMGILPLMSSKQAEFLHNEVPGMAIPQAVRDRLRRAGDGTAKEGVALAQEMLLSAKELVAGAYLLPSFGRYETIVEVVKVLK